MASLPLTRYGSWALVAGASEGLGAAFAWRLASLGFNLVLVSRRIDALKSLAVDIGNSAGVEVKSIVQDLADPEALERLDEETRELDVGVLVYNAALSKIGPFLSQSLAEHEREIDINCHGPLSAAHIFGRRFAGRHRGAIVLMSSLSCIQGSPVVANYAATKAYNLILGEGLWYELKPLGVDVVAVCAGATETPGYRSSNPRGALKAQDPGQVAREALSVLGKKPSMVPGFFNRFASFAMRRLIPRKAAVTLMGRTMEKMYPPV